MDLPTISRGFTGVERARVARLYWEAFAAKLGRVMRPEAAALAFLEGALDPGFALVARDANGRLLAAAGFKTAQGALVGGGLTALRAAYGLFGALWRAPLLSVLEREPEPGILLMDGIFVAGDARGRGLGSALLDAVAEEARAQGCTRVRLDVIDTNPRARALYERKGFRAVSAEQTGPLRWLFGFRHATRMERRLPDPAAAA